MKRIVIVLYNRGDFMSVRPVDFNGMMQNQQNVSNVKHSEDQKPMLQQHQALVTVTKQEQALAKQVIHKDNLDREEYRFDAREEGKNKYQGDQKKRKAKEKEKKGDGQVRVKGEARGFDITV